MLSFQTFFSSTLIVKCFQKVFKFLAALLSDMKCLSQHYSDFHFSWSIKACHFCFLGEESLSSVVKVLAAILNPVRMLARRSLAK